MIASKVQFFTSSYLENAISRYFYQIVYFKSLIPLGNISQLIWNHQLQIPGGPFLRYKAKFVMRVST